MVRVAFITNNYTPYAAGVVKSIDAITRQLQSMGHDVLIIAPQFLKNHDDPDWVKRIPSVLRFTYKRKHMAIPWRPSYYIKKYLRAFNPDSVHVHHPFLLGAIGCRIARKMGIPIFFTYHTIYEDYVHYVPLPASIMKPMVTHKVLQFCRLVDRIITPSIGIQNYLKQNSIENSTVIPSPLRPEFCQLEYTEKKLKAPYRLLCVSRFTKEKNLFALFRVLEQLSAHYHLTLVGYGDLEHQLRARAQRFGGRVQFVIDPSIEKLVHLYKQAHIFLFPSQTDTQGIVLAESMATGTPVLAFDGFGQRDIITQGYNGFIVKNSQAMGQKIVQMSSDQEAYRQLCHNAQKTAFGYYPNTIARDILCLYGLKRASSALK